MSLPGLELAEASIEAQTAPPPPSQINLRAGSEWRFEIAFGASVRVKVRRGFDLVARYETETSSEMKKETKSTSK